MNATPSEQTISTAVPAPREPDGAYEACEQCGSPVEPSQRYCVVCGTRRKHAYDPAAQFLSSATSRARSAGKAARPAGTRKRRSFSLGTAAVLAVIPLAVAVGVIVGRSPNDNNAKLLAALRTQKPTVVNVGGGASGSGNASRTGSGGSAAASTAAASSSASDTALTSDFSLQHGYTVELQTVPATGTTRATVIADERAGRAKGATAVGLVTEAGFRLTPSPPAGDDVIFSGQYKTQAEAQAALAKLKGKFPAAKVIAVQSSSAGGGSTAVVSHTAFGSAHQVDGFKPTASQLAAGGQIANRVSKQINSNYVNSQKGLPDSVSVP